MTDTAPSRKTEHSSPLQERWEKVERLFRINSSLLRRRGSLVQKRTASGRTVWCLRYAAPKPGGGTTHRLIYLGADAVLVARVRAVLQSFRQEKLLAREALQLARVA